MWFHLQTTSNDGPEELNLGSSVFFMCILICFWVLLVSCIIESNFCIMCITGASMYIFVGVCILVSIVVYYSVLTSK